MTCFFCKGEMKPSTTIHTVQLKNCVVVIKNVPCMECEQCGEVVLSADTVEKIERILQTVEKARLVVALYAGHPLALRRQRTRQELRGENILYMSPDAAPDSYGDAFFMQRYAEAGYKPNILFRSADTESILMMVAAEEGISLLPGYCTDRLYNADNLVFVPLVGEGRRKRSSPPGRAATSTRRWGGC